jgi:hypothetical protein
MGQGMTGDGSVPCYDRGKTGGGSVASGLEKANHKTGDGKTETVLPYGRRYLRSRDGKTGTVLCHGL